MKRIIRQILGWGMMLTLPLMMTSCEWFWDVIDTPVTPGVYVAKVNVTMKVGQTFDLRATTQPHVVLLYASANPSVATVDAEGVVTAIAEGTTTITIKAQGEDEYYRTEIFGENTTTVEVTVSKNDGSISFATANVPKYINDAKFTNTLTIDGDGVVTYTSDNTTVAEVDATTGEVTIKGVGTANIKATTTNTDTYAYETNTAQYTLTVDPAINLASISGNYTAQNGDVLTGTLAGNYKISIADGANVILKDVTINGVDDSSHPWAGLTCEDNVTITITGTNTIKGFYYKFPGIQAGHTGTLTINGTGKLTATGGDYAAGIGSGFDYATCGNITINSGTIIASSNGEGAGIGSGFSHSSCGDITINGGTINANSGALGAGIGSGANFSSCGDITINGGTVIASSNDSGAGIGSGFSHTTCGKITINGGDITASADNKGAGIGSGYFGSFGGITITSGVTKVQATINASDTWPIGKGNGDESSSSSEVIIAGATVTSRDWDGTGLSGLTLTGAGTNTWTLSHPTAP